MASSINVCSANEIHFRNTFTLLTAFNFLRVSLQLKQTAQRLSRDIFADLIDHHVVNWRLCYLPSCIATEDGDSPLGLRKLSAVSCVVIAALGTSQTLGDSKVLKSGPRRYATRETSKPAPHSRAKQFCFGSYAVLRS